jgi:F-box and leucine-rich repeat protein 6
LQTHSTNLEVLDISNITTTSRDTILINIEKFQKGCQKLKVFNANHTMLSLSETPIKEQVPNVIKTFFSVVTDAASK